MSLHKLSPEALGGNMQSLTSGISIQHRHWSITQAVVRTRALRAIGDAVTRHPIYRLVRCAARGNLEEVFDDLALSTALAAYRLDDGELLLDGPGVFAYINGARKSGYCSCTAEIWADTRVRAEETRETLLGIIGKRRVLDQTFVIDWQFSSGNNTLNNASFEEIAVEEVHDEAYPGLGESAMDFVRRYLAADETILILLGPPGSGKTRLVRTILGEMSRRKGEAAEIMYTCDKKTLENDEMFVGFITGSHDAFVIEDADHVLTPRANGNQDLHRFLAIADGVIRAQGRKIIFTTNLPNVGDLDDALLRPGRCFAAVHTRNLIATEAARLIAKLCGGDAERERVALATALPAGVKSCSVASVYRACAKIA